jgi:hypothetical protein
VVVDVDVVVVDVNVNGDVSVNDRVECEPSMGSLMRRRR